MSTEPQFTYVQYPAEFASRVVRAYGRPGLFGPKPFTSRAVTHQLRPGAGCSFKSNVSLCNAYLNAMVMDGLLGRSGGRGTEQKEVQYVVLVDHR